MLTAKEARELAESSISDETEEQLRLAEKCINDAATKGYTQCWYYSWLCNQAVKKLEEAGYSVKNISSQKEGITFQIGW